MRYKEAVGQKQGYENENSREQKGSKEGNLQEGGKMDAQKERKTRRKLTMRKLRLGNTRSLIEEPPKTKGGKN